MKLLILEEDIKDIQGNILLKANTPYISKRQEMISDKEYLVCDSELKNEVLIPLD